MKNLQTTAKPGLRLRSSPQNGEVIEILKTGSLLELLSEETWLKVKTTSGQIGYVLADYVEPTSNTLPITTIDIVNYKPNSNRVQGKPIRIDIDFIPSMKKIEELLAHHDLFMWVTSSLREPSQTINGAVVSPASLSNHLIGHAIDMNLYKDNDWYNSSRLNNIDILDIRQQQDPNPNTEERVRRLLYDLIQAPDNLELKKGVRHLRWGGQFTPKDSVHIDDGLNVNEKMQAEYYAKLKILWPEYLA
ncbi:M15 family metallopeptidase [Alteromonadaceae bacterium BrNp21-10]|nr:M15 family metallopeptidase [Alteromonadaceae bacterium BrNp21-10]